MSGALRPLRLVLSCEHASKRVPRAWRRLFAGRQRVLDSHRGWDPGALELARRLSRALRTPLAAAPATRLLADPNRSLHHPRLFSELSRGLDPAARARLLAEVYRPHRARVEARVSRAVSSGGRVLHLGVHSFTPRWAGAVRRTDVGLLYDPRRAAERELALALRRRLAASGRWRVHLNQPYRGAADGLTTALRGRFRDPLYIGLELELNQRHVRGRRASWLALQAELETAFAGLLRPALG